MIKEKYYKGYYMLTAKCNLSCSYCVLENSKNQIQQELNLAQKKELISHLYYNLNFRSLTISGGEALMIGNNPPTDFIELLRFLKDFKSVKNENNLRVNLYTNGYYINEEVANEMVDIIDEVSITIDSLNDKVLKTIGKNKNINDNYIESAVRVSKLLYDRNIRIKTHTVVSALNVNSIASEVKKIYNSLQNFERGIDSWKFFQYMSYDVPEIDLTHQISNFKFQEISANIQKELRKYKLKLHFKDNKEMNTSLFNILPYGNAQYMNENDTWLSSKRTKKLTNYQSITELFNLTNISQEAFNKYHTFKL